MLKPLAPIHAVQIRHRVGALDVDVDFTLTKRWTILFGPSGSGKTTILARHCRDWYVRTTRGLSARLPGTDQERSLRWSTRKRGVFLPAAQARGPLASQQARSVPISWRLDNMKYGDASLCSRREEAAARDKFIANLLTSLIFRM